MRADRRFGVATLALKLSLSLAPAPAPATALALALAPGLATALAALVLALAAPCPWASAAAAESSESGDAMRFELPQLDGSRFVSLDQIRAPWVLLNFWGSDCPPCVRELPLLDAWAAGQPAVTVIGIAVDAPDAALRFGARHPVRYLQLRAGADPRALLRRFGNRDGVLPFSVMLGPQRRRCASRRGELDAAWLQAALLACR